MWQLFQQMTFLILWLILNSFSVINIAYCVLNSIYCKKFSFSRPQVASHSKYFKIFKIYVLILKNMLNLFQFQLRLALKSISLSNILGTCLIILIENFKTFTNYLVVRMEHIFHRSTCRNHMVSFSTFFGVVFPSPIFVIFELHFIDIYVNE